MYNVLKYSKISEHIIDEILIEIHKNKLKIDSLINFELEAIGILYRWPIFVCTNMYIDKLLTVVYQIKIDTEQYSKKKIKSEFLNDIIDVEWWNNYFLNQEIFSTTEDCTYNHYFNNESNEKVFFLLKKILLNNNIQIQYTNIKKNKKISFIRLLANKYKKFIFLNRKFKNYVYEQSRWLESIFESKYLLAQVLNENYKINYDFRNIIKECASKVLHRYLKSDFNIENDIVKNNICKLFAEYLNTFLSIYLIEGLQDRIKIYSKFLTKNNIKQVHSTVGLYYDDNLKVLCALSKKKKIKLICHEHGINNFFELISKDDSIPNFDKQLTIYRFFDHYFSWGTNLECDIWDNSSAKYDVKKHSFGSVYLSKLNKWQHKPSSNKFTILLMGSPYRNHKVNLHEDWIQNIFNKKLKMKNFLEKALIKFEQLNVIYKPFPQTYKLDPIKDLLTDNSFANRIQLSMSNSVELMTATDLVLFDSISTGFAEAISMQVITLVYGDKYEYFHSSNHGKFINNKLYENEIIFYDSDSGLKKIDTIIKSNQVESIFQHDSIKNFQNSIAKPISKKIFINKLKNLFN